MARTALEIAREAALKLSLKQPSVLFSSTGRTEVELREALCEAADKMLFAHDWQVLKAINTHTGDGSTTEFAPPSDFLRMPKDAQIHTSRLIGPLQQFTPEQWLYSEVNNLQVTHGAWTLYGGNFVYKPAPTDGETLKFFYVSKSAYQDSNSAVKAKFDADDDTFRLDDRVLELLLVWIWRKQKGLDYAEDLQDAEIALARAIERDKGARVLTQPRRGFDVQTAYPISVTS